MSNCKKIIFLRNGDWNPQVGEFKPTTEELLKHSLGPQLQEEIGPVSHLRLVYADDDRCVRTADVLAELIRPTERISEPRIKLGSDESNERVASAVATHLERCDVLIVIGLSDVAQVCYQTIADQLEQPRPNPIPPRILENAAAWVWDLQTGTSRLLRPTPAR